MKNLGFEAVVLDKDNTVTVPYEMTLHSDVVESVGECKACFPGRVAVMSNSAGESQVHSSAPDAQWAQEAEGSIASPNPCTSISGAPSVSPVNDWLLQAACALCELHVVTHCRPRPCLPATPSRASSGLMQFDRDGSLADSLEQSLGVPVLRHPEKKPAGSAAALERQLRCSAQRIVFVRAQPVPACAHLCPPLPACAPDVPAATGQKCLHRTMCSCLGRG